MNILIPDSWLREYLETAATPKQIKEYLSLCGPSVERVNKVGTDSVYDIEVTTNRPDSMSILGIAREAAAILPRFGIAAKLKNDPYQDNGKNSVHKLAKTNRKPLKIVTNPALNPRWTSIVLDNIEIKPSPVWLQKKLELAGIRSLNTIVDITNYLMRAFGQPAHAFDYDSIKPEAGTPFMKLRPAKKGEKIVTLDGKAHILPGGDIVIEDGSGRLIDLCGIMGAQNSSITPATKTIVLFMQTYEPTHIRNTSMALAQRTEAAQLFEKGLDPQLVLPTVLMGINLVEELAGGSIASQLYDLYPNPYKGYNVSVTKEKLNAYIGVTLSDLEIKNILTPLGFLSQINKSNLTVTVPSFRPDIKIDVDIIEEVARIYGYHDIKTRLPETEPPIVQIDKSLTYEEEVKIRLRDWGFTETYSYSMISNTQMDQFGFNEETAYQITNPLSGEWVYMRPSLLPSLLTVVKENLNLRNDLKLFELSMIYQFRKNDLPQELPTLVIAQTGEHFLELKGIAETLFDLAGIPFPKFTTARPSEHWHPDRALVLGSYGTVGEINPGLLNQLKIKLRVSALEINFAQLITDSQLNKAYNPISKYPPIVEDISFEFPAQTHIGQVLEKIKSISPFIQAVTLHDQFEATSTFRIEYLNREKQLTATEVEKLRRNIIMTIQHEFSARVKGNF